MFRSFVELKSGLGILKPYSGPRPIDEKNWIFRQAFLEVRNGGMNAKWIKFRAGETAGIYGSGPTDRCSEGPQRALEL